MLSDDVFSAQVWVPMFQYLFKANREPALASWGLDADLAVALPALVPDATGGYTATVALRNSEFSDGHAVDAYDVAFGFQVLLKLEEGWPEEYRSWHNLGFTVDTIAVLDAGTLEFRFADSLADWAQHVTIRPVLPMHYWVPHDDDPAAAAAAYAALFDGGSYIGPLPEDYDDFDSGLDTFGSGPYRAHDEGLWDAENEVARLVRHPGSSTPTNGVESFTVLTLSREQALAGLAAGSVHVAESVYGWAPEELDAIEGVSAFVQDNSLMQTVGYNVGSTTLDDERVRQAIDLAIPRRRIIDETVDGLGTPARSFIPPANVLYDADFGEGGPFGPVYDVAAARARLREAGYTELLEGAGVLMAKQALLCNANRTLAAWVEDGLLSAEDADRILADLARAPVGR
jgi:ABC-type transport system substrate-binding protein